MTLFGAYQRDQYADPEAFTIQALMVFERYELVVAEYLTDPRNADALQHRHPTFSPTVGQIQAACEERSETLARLRQPMSRITSRPYTPPDRFPGYRANLFVGQDAPQYSELLQIAESGEIETYDWRFGKSPDGSRNGIWVSLAVWENRYAIVRRSTFKPLSDDELRAHYGRQEAELARERQKATTTTEEIQP